jgi:hypothetical protein
MTLKAPNFGPHGNFGPFFASFVASLDESCTKHEHNQICGSKVFLQLVFTSFFCRRVLMIASPSEKEAQGFHMVQS